MVDASFAPRYKWPMRRYLKLGAWAAGPITGPLLLGFIGAIRDRRYAMAAVYALGIEEVILGLPKLAAYMLKIAMGG